MSMDDAVAAVFAAHAPPQRSAMMALRSLILDTAASIAGVGPLDETLKWGQISYLTTQSGSGTTIRLDVDKASGRVALYVNCKTDLVSRYRAHYPDAFEYQGNRAVVLPDEPDLPALRHVIALALTYHAAKKAG